MFPLEKTIGIQELSLECKSGDGFLDVAVYYDDLAQIFELKIQNNLTEKNKNEKYDEAISQIYSREYLSQVMMKIQSEENKRNIRRVELIPAVLYKLNGNGKWLCQMEKRHVFPKEEAIELVETLNKCISSSSKNKIIKRIIQEKENQSNLELQKKNLKQEEELLQNENQKVIKVITSSQRKSQNLRMQTRSQKNNLEFENKRKGAMEKL